MKIESGREIKNKNQYLASEFIKDQVREKNIIEKSTKPRNCNS